MKPLTVLAMLLSLSSAALAQSTNCARVGSLIIPGAGIASGAAELELLEGLHRRARWPPRRERCQQLILVAPTLDGGASSCRQMD